MDKVRVHVRNKKYFFEQVLQYIKQAVCARYPQYKNLMFLVDDLSFLLTASVVLCF